MKKLHILLLTIISAGALVVNAQVPGYQGKRFYVGYTPEFSMPNLNPNYGGKIALSGAFAGFYEDTSVAKFTEAVPLAFNMTHKLSLNYVLKRTSVLTADIKYFRSGCILPQKTMEEYVSSTYYETNVNSEFTKLAGVGVDIQYRLFSNKLAPFGKYAGYYIGFAMVSAQVPDSLYVVYDPFNSYYRAAGAKTWQKVKFTNVALGYVYGKQNIIKDKIIFDRGISIDILGLCVAALKENDMNYGLTATTMTESYITDLKRRVQWRNSLMIYTGVKYLLK